MTANDDSRLRLYCWEGYEHALIAERFARESGQDIEVETLLSDAGAARRLLASDPPPFDLININNAYVRDCLAPAGLVRPLDASLEAEYRAAIHPLYEPYLRWSYDAGGRLIGIGQRFGPFNLVVNTRAIDPGTARTEGFNLADDPANRKRYAILDYPDFNLFHVCIGAGLNPFVELSAGQLDRFEEVARRWHDNALLVDADHHRLNRALVGGEIDFYLSGGIYTASPARLEGHGEVFAVTPASGPIGGKGGIVFSEITSVLEHAGTHPGAEDFLRFMLQPQTAIDIAFVDGTCNPVAQMGDPRVFDAFDRRQLDAIQWDTLEEDLARCAEYRIPPSRDELFNRLERARVEC